MSAGGFVAALAMTVAIFGLFYAEVRYQRRRFVSDALRAYAAGMRLLGLAFADATAAAEEAAFAMALLGEVWIEYPIEEEL